MAKLKANMSGKDRGYIYLKIRKNDFEAFCSAAGLFKDSFLETLKKSEKDLAEGRVTKRKSLTELLSN